MLKSPLDVALRLIRKTAPPYRHRRLARTRAQSSPIGIAVRPLLPRRSA